ncbi:hypothetical protein G6F70_004034 [Rhizopus microsporus]|uniref:CAP-Gly domain-containing protein n=2 Tax=Rhizopus TaxID=4842 RepID=A0A367J7L7_RHIAZ|nr:hypothetical protein G6F71_008412 [Rhizopus microsporus]RCH85962.1 hypothetical protein CU097_008063 [Rhizopus azygosporus]KAG1200458.1 hypothetical protein G6F70_004034 [Rhizopus microsporus]KAG1207035.1 hypothetical protein G6F69_008369 [Rhizopus microsporus]KAG1227640.1 hypothetical protein G6F67_008324 [Rhizopus microsporus]
MRKYSIDSIDTSPPNVILALTPESNNSNPSIYAVSNSSSPTTAESSTDSVSVPEKIRWSCHKDVLRANSNYFNSIFNSQFQEAEASIVFLPRGMFSASVLDAVLYYMYTKTLLLEHDDKDLELIQSLYLAADYLGMEQLCITIEQHITTHLTHGFNCYCENCALIIPLLLSFTGPNQQDDARLSKMTLAIVKLLTQDPEKALPTFWSSRSMVLLLTQNPEMESLHEYLENGLLNHVNKNNAIESLYGCFLAQQLLEKKKNEFDTILLEMTISKVVKTGSHLLANDFDFYCTKYPKLLSCVDGVIYSFDFLIYVISIVLDSQMNERNASLLYKGIVKHLMCRDTVQNSSRVKSILQMAKDKVVKYIGANLFTMRKLNLIDKSVIDSLSQDLAIHPSVLTTDQEDIRRKQNTSTQENKRKSYHQVFGWNIKLMRTRFSFFLFGQHFKIGQKVQLLNRPIITTGTIAYVGKIPIKEGEQSKHAEYMLGIELDRRVGTNDGSIDGKRYFTTSPNRGVFVKPSDVVLL